MFSRARLNTTRAKSLLIFATASIILLNPILSESAGAQSVDSTSFTAQGSSESFQSLGLPSHSSDVGEIKALRTETSRTIRNTDGTLTAEVFTAPIHYEDGGGFKRIDNTLVPSDRPGYAFENAANSFKVLIPNEISSTPIRIEFHDEWLEFRPEGASGSPVIDGEAAVFESAIQDVDLIYEVSNTRIEEFFRLHSAESPRDFDFSVETSSGFDLDNAESDNLFLGEAGGHDVSFAPPLMYEENDTSTTSPAVDLNIGAEEADGDTPLEVEAEDAWLDEPTRDYPVLIDPTVDTQGEDLPRACWIRNEAPSAYDCAGTSLKVGASPNSNLRRSLLSSSCRPCFSQQQPSCKPGFISQRPTLPNN